MLRFVPLSLSILSVSAPSAAETWYVSRYQASAYDRPALGGMEVARLSLGAKVEVTESQAGWRHVKLADGKDGWIRRGALVSRPLSERWLCRRGQVFHVTGNFVAAITYLQLAMDRGTKRRPCLEALVSSYRARGETALGEKVQARIRELEDWLRGDWCGARQVFQLSLAKDGTYQMLADGKKIGAGRYRIWKDELRLADTSSRSRDLVLLIRKRGFGHALVAPNADELIREFCP